MTAVSSTTSQPAHQRAGHPATRVRAGKIVANLSTAALYEAAVRDGEGMIAMLKASPGTPAERAKLDPLLAPFLDLGGRNAAKKLLELPKGTKVKVPPEVIKAVSRGFWRAIGAIGLHDK